MNARTQREAEFEVRLLRWIRPRVEDFVLRTQVLGHGLPWFRREMLKEFAGFKDLVTYTRVAEAYAGLCRAHVVACGQATPSQVLNALEVPTPPTQREIDAAWVVDSASSEAGRRALYGDKHPMDVIHQEDH